MGQATPLPFASWQNFYVIVGSSAGALTGLQFVVLTLLAQAKKAATTREISAFGTPTVVHFCTALLISALMTAPWRAASQFAPFLGTLGILGVLYSIRNIWHAHKAAYNPDTEDWIWYSALPILAHLGFIAIAISIPLQFEWALWAIAADTLLFLLLGIHNSWDTITFIVLDQVASTNNTPPDKS